jgi:hypothetical protein
MDSVNIHTGRDRWILPPVILLFLSICGLIMPFRVCAQAQADGALEKMPTDLETDFALSSLPPHLRAGATVYLLDPAKGFYISRPGTNGFICFVSRMEWEWADFRNDLATPISYDAEGARTILPVYLDMAAMRASGKFTAGQVKDSVIDRINRGVYKAPGRAGISYMLAPLMRSYTGKPGQNEIKTISVPHYMFYAPYMTDADIGGMPPGPFVGNTTDEILGERKGPHGYIILMAGQAERAKIVEENKDLLRRLMDYKSYFTIEPGMKHHS